MRSTKSALFGLLCLAGAASAFEFDVTSADCDQVTWTINLSTSEWIRCSEVQFFIRDPQGVNPTYTDNLSCTTTGDIQSPGMKSFRTTPTFAPNALNWVVGASVLDVNDQVITSPNTLRLEEQRAVNNCQAGIGGGFNGTATSVAGFSVSSASATASVTGFASRTASGFGRSTALTFGTTTTRRGGPTSTFGYSSGDYKDAVNIGAIVGGVIGGIALLVTGLLIAWLLLRRKRQRKQQAAYNDQLAASTTQYGYVPAEKPYDAGEARPFSGVSSDQPYNGNAASAPYDSSYGNAGSAAPAAGAGTAGLGAGALTGPGAAAAMHHSGSPGTHEDPTLSPSQTNNSYPAYSAEQATYGQDVTSPPSMSPLVLGSAGSGLASENQGNVGGFANPHDYEAHNGPAPTDAPRPNPLLGAMPDWTPSSSMPTAEPLARAEDGAPANATPHNEVLLNEPMSKSDKN